MSPPSPRPAVATSPAVITTVASSCVYSGVLPPAPPTAVFRWNWVFDTLTSPSLTKIAPPNPAAPAPAPPTKVGVLQIRLPRMPSKTHSLLTCADPGLPGPKLFTGSAVPPAPPRGYPPPRPAPYPAPDPGTRPTAPSPPAPG